MRIRIRLVGFPDIRDRWGTDSTEADLEGRTVAELLQWFEAIHAGPAGTKILDPEGQLDGSVQVVRNGEEWLGPGRLDDVLSEGDEITLIVLVAGG